MLTMDTTSTLKVLYYATLMIFVLIRKTFGVNDLGYLLKYGYLGPTDGRSDSLITEDYLKKALADFQRFAGLPVTGEANKETLETMALPRCGVSDHVGTGDNARRKRYALHGSKWRKRVIYYRISIYSRKLSMDDCQRELQRAFDIWSEVIPVRFIRREYGTVDIEVKFVTGHHDDNTPFDGSGQTLAHAYFPQYGGDAHFDDDEKWTVHMPDGVNLYQVAAHEFGHSLGLAHSDVRSALMAPFYRGYDPNFKLDMDDILAAQELYGTKQRARVMQTTTTTAPFFHTTSRSRVSFPDICLNASINAITRTDNGITYIFKDEHYYRLNDYGIEHGYPRLIHGDWGTVRGPIDAALTWPNGWTFIFKAHQYWKFHNQDMKYGPRNISEGFDGIPDNIDTAFVWSGNGKTYFKKDNNYWRYYGNRIDYGYPREWRIWRGLSDNITAAFQWRNGKTYFFSGDQYYRYDDQNFDVDGGGYPRSVATWWLGCPEESRLRAYHSPDTSGDKRYGDKPGNGDDVQRITVNYSSVSDQLSGQLPNNSDILQPLQFSILFFLVLSFSRPFL